MLRERKTAQRLAHELTQLGALPARKGVLQAVGKRLRAVREALLHGTWSDAHNVATARELLNKALVGLAAQEELRDEQGAPLVIFQTRTVPTEQAKPLPTGSARLAGTQRQLLAELEALLGRRSRFEQQSDRLLTVLHRPSPSPKTSYGRRPATTNPCTAC